MANTPNRTDRDENAQNEQRQVPTVFDAEHPCNHHAADREESLNSQACHEGDRGRTCQLHRQARLRAPLKGVVARRRRPLHF